MQQSSSHYVLAPLVNVQRQSNRKLHEFKKNEREEEVMTRCWWQQRALLYLHWASTVILPLSSFNDDDDDDMVLHPDTHIHLSTAKYRGGLLSQLCFPHVPFCLLLKPRHTPYTCSATLPSSLSLFVVTNVLLESP